MGIASSWRPSVLLVGLVVAVAGEARAIDCNGNGTDDADEIARGSSADCNLDGIPDECDVSERRFEYRLDARHEFPDHRLNSLVAVLERTGGPDIAVAARLRASRSEAALVILRNDGSGRFLPGEPMILRETVRAMRAEDLDGDGESDLVLALPLAVRIHWGGGDPPFGDFEEIAVGSDPVLLEAGDFDGDGDRDLVTANFLASSPLPDNVTVLSNEGDRRFAARNFVAGREPSILEAGDLDRDGDLDLLIASAESNVLMVLVNDGSGRFSQDDTLAVEFEGPPRSLAFGDLDADGDLDAAVIERETYLLRVLFNDGRGRLERSLTLEDPSSAGFVRIFDADGDAAPDIVLVGSCDTIAVFLGDGDGTFPAELRLAGGERMTSFDAGDFNGDGILDVAGPEAGAWAIEIFLGTRRSRSEDCNRNGVPDECEEDCNGNGTLDACEIAGGAPDCNGNGIPDACESDCDHNGVPDACDVQDGGVAVDCDADGIPDACELGFGDRDGNGVLDACDIARDPSLDCNGNEIPDALDLLPRVAFSREEYPAGYWPGGLAAGDLDGDGQIDLVTINYHSTLTLLSNRRHDGFAVVREIELAGRVNDVALLDLDGDGDLDLVVAGGAKSCGSDRGSVWAFTNDGGGNLTKRSRQSVPTRVNLVPYSIAAGDFDGDRFPDVIVGTSVFPGGLLDDGSTWLLRGCGDGRLAAAEKLADRGWALFAADLDGDGDLDVGSRTGLLLLNQGAGVFSEGPSLPTDWIASGDLDGDGDVDLVAPARVFLNRGDGSFAPGPDLPSPGGGSRLADLDGDGRLDLAGASKDTVGVQRNIGEATFAPAVLYPAGAGVLTLGAADLDGDGDVDLVTANGQPGSITVHRNDALGRFGSPFLPEAIRSSAVGADFDGDGDVDVAAGVFFDNDGRGGYQKHPGFELPKGLLSSAAVDLDGDSDVDLAIAVSDVTQGSRVEVYRNDGRWSFTKLASLTSDAGLRFVAAGDFDADGDADLAAIQRPLSHSVLLYPNLGSGVFGDPTSFELVDRAETLTPAGLDGDGAADLIVHTEHSGLEVWMNDGDGTFSRGTVLVEPSPGGLLALPPVAGDFDGDGDTDVAFGLDPRCNQTDCDWQLAVALNEGDGSFSIPSAFAFPVKASVLTACDVDGDRDLDLVAGNVSIHASEFGEIIVSTNRGDGTFRVGRRYSQGYSLRALIAADLDGDGLGDVAVVQDTGIWPLLSRSLPPESTDRDGDGVLDDCQDVRFRRGDANRDGAMDLADAVFLLRFVFLGSDPPACWKSADADDSGTLGATDAIRVLAYLFLGWPAPPQPFLSCGADPTADDLPCERFEPCR